MAAKMVFIAGCVGICGYVGHNAMKFDPAVFPIPQDQVRTLLTDAETVLPRRDGDGKIRIWGIGATDRGVALKMQYSSDAPVLSCEAVVTATAPDKSRVVADCGHTNPGSAQAKFLEEARAPMFDEHIQATLGNRPFDRKQVDNKEAALVFKNLGGMQREALQMSDQMQREQAEAKAAR